MNLSQYFRLPIMPFDESQAKAALSKIYKLSTTAQALSTRGKLARNISDNPLETKFHTLKLTSNLTLQKRFRSTPQCVVFLKAMGFENNDGVLAFQPAAFNHLAFKIILQDIESAVELRNAKGQTAIHASKKSKRNNVRLWNRSFSS